MLEEASELRAGEAGAQGLFRGGLFGMVGISLMAVLWVGGSHVGDGSMTVRSYTASSVTFTPLLLLSYTQRYPIESLTAEIYDRRT